MESIKEIIAPMFSDIVAKYPATHRTAFQLLEKLFSNIVNNPAEPKFRKFKKTNEHLKAHVLIIPEILDILSVIGYAEGTKENADFLIYETDSLENLKDSLAIIRDKLSSGVAQAHLDGAEKVTVYQYDLTNGLARNISRALIGKQIDGVWHTSVVCFGKEYFYGGGICTGVPKKTPYGYPVRELDFGYTYKRADDVRKFIQQNNSNFSTQNYNLLNHNCNHFTDALLLFLTGKHLPNNILNQHEELLKTPIGNMIKPYLESMSQNNNAFLPNMFEGNRNNNYRGY